MKDKIAKLKSIELLFVEDEQNLVDIISDTFSKLGLTFKTANNGAQALEILKENPNISLVITDINMPVMNGLDMIIEAQKMSSNLQFVIMSAHTEPEYVKSATELGVTNYLIKPFDFIKFLNIVSQIEF